MVVYRRQIRQLTNKLDALRRNYDSVVADRDHALLQREEAIAECDRALLKHDEAIEKYEEVNHEYLQIKNDYEEVVLERDMLLHILDEIQQQQGNVAEENDKLKMSSWLMQNKLKDDKIMLEGLQGKINLQQQQQQQQRQEQDHQSHWPRHHHRQHEFKSVPSTMAPSSSSSVDTSVAGFVPLQTINNHPDKNRNKSSVSNNSNHNHKQNIISNATYEAQSYILHPPPPYCFYGIPSYGFVDPRVDPLASNPSSPIPFWHEAYNHPQLQHQQQQEYQQDATITASNPSSPPIPFGHEAYNQHQLQQQQQQQEYQQDATIMPFPPHQVSNVDTTTNNDVRDNKGMNVEPQPPNQPYYHPYMYQNLDPTFHPMMNYHQHWQ